MAIGSTKCRVWGKQTALWNCFSVAYAPE